MEKTGEFAFLQGRNETIVYRAFSVNQARVSTEKTYRIPLGVKEKRFFCILKDYQKNLMCRILFLFSIANDIVVYFIINCYLY